MAFDEQMCAPGTSSVGLKDDTDSEEWLFLWLCFLCKREHEFAWKKPIPDVTLHWAVFPLCSKDQQITENDLAACQLFGLFGNYSVPSTQPGSWLPSRV